MASRRAAAIEQIKEGFIPNELRTSTLVSVAVILLMRPSASALLERAESAGLGR